MATSKDAEETHTVVVIGCGVAGLACGTQITRKWGPQFDFKIYEKSSGVGGTWHANTYPGCSCDVYTHFYSLSTDLNPEFSNTHPPSSELLAYWESVAQKYHLYGHLEFRQDVKSIEWDHSSSNWHLIIENLETGSRKFVKARFVVSAIGLLEVPSFSNIPGVSDFKGDLFHSARWDHSISLENKRVGVIGNGASSVQFVPAISQDKTVEVTQFIRKPNWYIPNLRASYGPVSRWLFANIPGALRLYRVYLFLVTELLYLLVFKSPVLRALCTALGRMYIKSQAPPEIASALLPSYEIGCKRIILDPGHLASLRRPNVKVNLEPIERIVPEGIKSKTGEVLNFDVIIMATGFVADRFPLRVVGRDGQTLQDFFETKDGPTAHLGTTVPNFPNFFILGGPNTVTGHTSLVYTEEIQSNYALQCIEKVLSMPAEQRVAVEVKAEALEKHNRWLEKRLSKSVFYTCTSWYRAGGTGRVTGIFPGSSTSFWLKMRNVNWKDYDFVLPPGGDSRKLEDVPHGSC